MSDPSPDNRRGYLSAEQHERLSTLASASGWARHVRALGRGINLAQLARVPPEGLAADLAERRVIAAEATLALEPLPGTAPGITAWLARLDDGQTLTLAPGVWLPPGRQRVYVLPRTRWIVSGEARPEQWDDYRALVLRAHGCEPAQLDALRAGRLPPAMRPALRARVRGWWLLLLLAIACIVSVASDGTRELEVQLVSALLFGLVGLWALLRIVPAYLDARRGQVRAIEGPLAIEIVLGRRASSYSLVVAGERVRLAGSDVGAALVATLHEGMPYRLYRAPTSGLFIAIEAL